MEVNLPAFRARFPEFVNVKDADVQAALDDALAEIEEPRWSAKDYPRAVFFFAAHHLALGIGQSGGTTGGDTGEAFDVPSDVFVRSIGFGERRVMFGERQKVGAGGGYKYGPGEAVFEQTYYGQRYLTLRERNIIAARLV